MELFEEMHDAGVEAGLMTYNTVIAACVRAENAPKAMSIFDIMGEKGMKRDQASVVTKTN